MADSDCFSGSFASGDPTLIYDEANKAPISLANSKADATQGVSHISPSAVGAEENALQTQLATNTPKPKPGSVHWVNPGHRIMETSDRRKQSKSLYERLETAYWKEDKILTSTNRGMSGDDPAYIAPEAKRDRIARMMEGDSVYNHRLPAMAGESETRAVSETAWSERAVAFLNTLDRDKEPESEQDKEPK